MWGGDQGKPVIGKPQMKIFYVLNVSANYFIIKLLAKLKKLRPSLGITNPAKIFVTCLGHEICLKVFSMQKIFMACN